ncbi:uncharacterized protein [Nerophis lumbriciformis]|uniref:uncharacterized protein n=1 Tax=Nerophis lumbriciformis TaxID=546530 RepID=UPI003BAB109D
MPGHAPARAERFEPTLRRSCRLTRLVPCARALYLDLHPDFGLPPSIFDPCLDTDVVTSLLPSTSCLSPDFLCASPSWTDKDFIHHALLQPTHRVAYTSHTIIKGCNKPGNLSFFEVSSPSTPHVIIIGLSSALTAFFHLRNIAKIRSILSTSDAEIIIHAFVTSRLDYCNVLFSGLPMSSIKKLQLVQNAAARLLTRTRKFDHITPILAQLHWLPVHLRCDFKVLLLTYKILHGLAPSYLVDCIVPYVPARNLRSKNSGLLVIPRAQKKSAGYRAFSIRAPVLWNALPVTIRDATSVEAFKSQLKTHLYTLAFK